VAISYGFHVLTMRRSIMTEKIARRGRHIYREYGVDPLERFHVSDLMTVDLITVDAAVAVEDAAAGYFGATQLHRCYPVVDQQRRLLGLLDRDALRSARGATCGELFSGMAATQVALPEETVRAVAARMAAHGLERMAVVDNRDSMRLVGLISRSDILAPSHGVFLEEMVREKLF
jgi:CBS domain-containing protein